jgi:Rieske Fe-S protein
VFVFAWLPFVLAGAEGQPAIDRSFDSLAAVRQRQLMHAAGRRVPLRAEPALTRRALVARGLGATGGVALVLSAIATVAKARYVSGATRLAARASAPTRTGSRSASPDTTSSTSAPRSTSCGVETLPSGAVRIDAPTQLARDQSALYTDPGHKPDIIIRQNDGSLSAFSAMCTHQGCQVGYQGGGQIACPCPCHGGLYNARTGADEAGPPPSALPRRRVLEHAGAIYAIPA